MREKRHPEATPEALAEWAQAVRVMDGLARWGSRRDSDGSIPPVEHPAILIQAALQETFRPASPTEIYSDDRPTFVPRSPQEEDWVPIDILLGCYQARNRTIRIFHRNIQHFASAEFHCNVSDLEAIVRLHEYAHALVHLGLFWKEEPASIRDYPPGKATQWKAFLRARSRAFRSLSADTHEFLAQVLCWAAIGVQEPLSERYTLQELFLTVMGRQPPEYRLSPDIIGKASYADPTALLSWARQTPRSKPTRRTPDRHVAEALLRATFP